MYQYRLTKCLWILLALLSTPAMATRPVVNGTRVGDESAYGPARSIQDTDTQFGDATNGDPRYANGGSELDQVFATIAGGRLYMLLAGNLESNFNKMEVFIDSVPGGSNTLVGSNLPTGVDAFCCGGFGTTSGALQRMNGLTFDAGVNPDYYLTFANGNENNGVGGLTFWGLTAHYAELNNGPTGRNVRVGLQLGAFGMEPGLGQGVPVDQNNNTWPTPYGGGTIPEHEFVEPWDPQIDPTNSRNHRDMANFINLRMAIDNSNTQGVVFTSIPPWNTIGNPQDVFTGLEFSIPLSEIGNPAPGSTIKITAFINGGGHDYASNQFAGDGVLQNNLGGDGLGNFTGSLSGVNLASKPGNQFITLTMPSLGDFDNSGSYNCLDVDALVGVIAAGTNNPLYDLTGDDLVNAADLNAWLREAGNVNLGAGRVYRPGDATLDGYVDGQDFNRWNENKGTNQARWCAGDFNANGQVNNADFAILNANLFTSSFTAVPEPSATISLIAVFFLALGIARR